MIALDDEEEAELKRLVSEYWHTPSQGGHWDESFNASATMGVASVVLLDHHREPIVQTSMTNASASVAAKNSVLTTV